MVASSNTSIAVYDECPECDFKVRFNTEPEIGQRLTCPECHTSLEVINLVPLKLDWAFIAQDDMRLRGVAR